MPPLLLLLTNQSKKVSMKKEQGTTDEALPAPLPAPFTYNLGNLGKMENDKELKMNVKVRTVDTFTEKGKSAKAVLLDNGEVAIIKKGSGFVAEEAMAASKGNAGVYMSEMIARCGSINGVAILVEDLRDEFSIAEYQLLRNAFAEINF